MRTISLRYTDKFAPKDGTIKEHEKIIGSIGYCWYGKLGNSISDKVIKDILKNDDPKILLIHSGTNERYWMHVTEIKKEKPPLNEIPEYYRYMENFNVWFKAVQFEKAPEDIMSKSIVASTKRKLSEASKHSMSPYFIIDVDAE